MAPINHQQHHFAVLIIVFVVNIGIIITKIKIVIHITVKSIIIVAKGLTEYDGIPFGSSCQSFEPILAKHVRSLGGIKKTRKKCVGSQI